MRSHAFIIIFAAFLLFAPLTEAKSPKVTIEEAEIYFGDPGDYEKPAVCNVDAIYAKIPEYKKIKARGLGPDDARYLILMRSASDKFRTAIEAVADDEGYDLIGGLGSIKIQGKKVPNITKLVIAELPD